MSVKQRAQAYGRTAGTKGTVPDEQAARHSAADGASDAEGACTTDWRNPAHFSRPNQNMRTSASTVGISVHRSNTINKC